MPGADARVAVESWAPGYGSALRGDADVVPVQGPVDVDVEVPGDRWGPRTTVADSAAEVVFIDGVRRVDARLWITDDRGTRPGIAVSLAAGIVVCDGAATVGPVQIRRGVVGQAQMPALRPRGARYEPMHVGSDDLDTLLSGAHERLATLERDLARELPATDLVVVDGPLSDRHDLPRTIGYVKSHHMAYLPDAQAAVVTDLGPGQRTPLFVVQTTRTRYSWYLRLPFGRGHPWAGIVRCEAAADLSLDAAAELADVSAATLPRFASHPHKDPRAPQNLYPIAGLERHLRRLLGDPAVLERALRQAVTVR